MSDFVVNQTSLLTAGDGTNPSPLMSKMGLLAYMDKWDFLALQGRMFNVHENTIGTALTGSAAAAGAIVLTAPTVRLTVPSGTTLFPHAFHVNLVSLAAVEAEFAVVISDTDTYTSGGTALHTPYNLRTDDPRDTACTNKYHCSGSAIVENTLSNPRKIFTRGNLYASTAVTDVIPFNFKEVWEHFIPCVGPCSVLIFLSSKTTALTYEFDFTWAEIPSVSTI